MANVLFMLQGAPGCGKSTFIEVNGWEQYVVSPDAIRALIEPNPMLVAKDDARNPMLGAGVSGNGGMTMTSGYDFSGETSAKAFDIALEICEARFRREETVIFDSICARRRTVGKILQKAVEYRYHIVFVNMQEGMAIEDVLRQNAFRGQRSVPEDAVRKAYNNVRSWESTKYEDAMTPEQMFQSQFVKPMDWDESFEFGSLPVTVIGDVQGCFRRLQKSGVIDMDPHNGHHVVFTGDLFDRGPADEAGPLFDWLVDSIDNDQFTFVRGNHDAHMRLWASESVPPSYGKATRETISEVLRDSKKVHGSSKMLRRLARKIYDATVPFALFDRGGKTFLITHGGLHPQTVNNAIVGGGDTGKWKLGFMSGQELWHGDGTTIGRGDYSTDIDSIIQRYADETGPSYHTSRPIIQIHGHRNEYRHRSDEFTSVVNLESRVEHEDGCLSTVNIMADGAMEHEWFK